MNAQMLEVSRLGVGAVPRLERDAWSKVKRLKQAIIHEYPPRSPFTRFLGGCSSPFMRLAEHLTALRGGASNVCLVGENPTCSVPA